MSAFLHIGACVMPYTAYVSLTHASLPILILTVLHACNHYTCTELSAVYCIPYIVVEMNQASHLDKHFFWRKKRNKTKQTKRNETKHTKPYIEAACCLKTYKALQTLFDFVKLCLNLFDFV